ncbi:hypothetical protein TNCV_1110461 [Trichonephila clavipes]|nr:hypothetical protein TNCV_1110461 [Trichonephila clavipes]
MYSRQRIFLCSATTVFTLINHLLTSRHMVIYGVAIQSSIPTPVPTQEQSPVSWMEKRKEKDGKNRNRFRQRQHPIFTGRGGFDSVLFCFQESSNSRLGTKMKGGW